MHLASKCLLLFFYLYIHPIKGVQLLKLDARQMYLHTIVGHKYNSKNVDLGKFQEIMLVIHLSMLWSQEFEIL